LKILCLQLYKQNGTTVHIMLNFRHVNSYFLVHHLEEHQSAILPFLFPLLESECLFSACHNRSVMALSMKRESLYLTMNAQENVSVYYYQTTWRSLIVKYKAETTIKLSLFFVSFYPHFVFHKVASVRGLGLLVPERCWIFWWLAPGWPQDAHFVLSNFSIIALKTTDKPEAADVVAWQTGGKVRL
jgi:hypothetical protein